MARPVGDERTAAVAAALAPYAWRGLTERMLVRRVVGALDQHQLTCFLSGLPGTSVSVMDVVEPAEADDDRVDALVSALEGQPWRGWSLVRLCADLASSLAAWHAQRESFESDLRRLLDDR